MTECPLLQQLPPVKQRVNQSHGTKLTELVTLQLMSFKINILKKKAHVSVSSYEITITHPAIMKTKCLICKTSSPVIADFRSIPL